ncbi:MAG TPA: neutral zinc metallopeptidase [Steroidobacteraceae bacterium]|nr:neutral zinc metallopeptidase [Steroidobacteraceae bacterium]
MRWEGNRESDNVEDRRSEGGGPRIGGLHLGLGGIVIALIAGWIFGINPLTMLGLLSNSNVQAPSSTDTPAQAPPANDQLAAFVSTILASTEDVWGGIFMQMGRQYERPRLVLFRDETATACGAGETAMGPFYCPQDRKVYIDLAFYQTLKNQLNSPGDFAEAYVIAHEVGHHVQNLLGITDRVDAQRGRMSRTEMNALSVRVELQADCFAGVWANHSEAERKWLDQGDVEQALNAASHIGDDALQRQSQGRVVPESFTHGTSAQRVGWFKRGMQGGRIQDCDTFASTAP